MFFAPHVKNKRGGNWNILPFPPPCSEEGQKFYKGIFTGVSIEVCDTSDILALYNNGFYGKGSHSRSVPNALIKASQDNTLGVEETLSLGLEEAFFLSYYLKVLQISDLSNKELKWQDLMTAALNINDNFMESLASYLYLKSKGWVVKSGLKFAGNYLIYRKGPRFYHASFVVIVKTPSNNDHLEQRRLKGLQRIAETSDKDVLLLDVTKPADFRMQNLEDITELCISETVIKRFNYTSFVQQNQRNIT